MGYHRDDDWFACPTCGSEVRVGSGGCSTCALDGDADQQEDAPDLGLANIPAGYSHEDDFDYHEFVENEFGGKPRNRLNPVWIAMALALLLVLLFLVLASRLP